MGYCMFCYPDYTAGSSLYTSALSGGSWEASLPLANLKDKLKSKLARSTDATIGSTTFNLDLGTARTSRLVAILNHNGTINGTVRVRFYSDAGYTTLVHDSGTESLIGDPDILPEVLLNWRPDWWKVLSSSVAARYVKVDITDTSNPDGYFELGRFCVMGSWTPGTVNISWGQSLTYDHSNTGVSKALSGTPFFDRKTPVRVSTFKFEALQPGEAHSAWLEMQRQLGKDGEIFFVKDSSETNFYRKQQSFLGNIEQQDPLENAYIDAFSTGATIREII